MNRIIISIMAAILLPLFISGCGKSGASCEDCYGGTDYRGLYDCYDRCDCRYRHGRLAMPEELYDARDFRHDSLYGDYHGWRDDESGKYHKKRTRWSRYHRYHHHDCPYHRRQDALSERFLPHVWPDHEYDE
jgi:hypothetical protein